MMERVEDEDEDEDERGLLCFDDYAVSTKYL